MRSSTGEYYIGLDHLRALATFQVFTWHFLQYPSNGPLSAPVPWAFLAEGHFGVALFMTLSGYIFAKLLSGKDIVYSRFVRNRCVRLLPLLLFVICLVAAKAYWRQGTLGDLPVDIALGWILPTLPNGGWSITAEFHFYLLLPWLLLMMRRWRRWLWLSLSLTIGARLILWLQFQTVHEVAYWTIVGRYDQFLLGLYAFELRRWVKGNWITGVVALAALLGYFTWFDAIGGYYATSKNPTLNAIWIIEPTVEAVLCATLICWYDQFVVGVPGKLSKAIAAVGNYSYSIYLLHPFFVFWMARTVHHRVVPLDNVYVGMSASLVCFCCAVPIGYVSFKLIESPFLKFRVPYLSSRKTQ